MIQAGRNVSRYELHFRFVANRIRVGQQSWTPIYGRPVRAIERNEISPSPASAVMGVAPEDDLNLGFV